MIKIWGAQGSDFHEIAENPTILVKIDPRGSKSTKIGWGQSKGEFLRNSPVFDVTIAVHALFCM
jgi:hypothetical protein